MPNNAHLSLFSGIGGLDLAAEWAGFRTVAFVERDKYCQRVLAKHWPGVPIYSDVAELGYASFMQRDGGGDNGGGSREGGREIPQPRDADRSPRILSGGFPCQPHSVAGKRKASLDERDLWSECARITGEFKPRWAVFENVPGLLSSEGGTFFARVLGDLAALGYRVGWGVWGANDVGALHRRDRVFIVAHTGSLQRNDGADREEEHSHPPQRPTSGDEQQRSRGVDWVGAPGEDVADATIGGCAGSRERGKRSGQEADGEGQANHAFAERFGGVRCAESRLGGMVDGLPDWAHEPDGIPRVASGVKDRVSRLRALGNAVVPQQAYPLFKAIAEIEGITQ